MIRIAVTGGIASGKTVVCRMFSEFGLPVFDADAAVHRLYGREEVTRWFARHIPEAVKEQTIHRPTLAAVISGDPSRLEEIEAMIHPLVWEMEQRFFRRHAALGTPAVISDIPLLIESQSPSRHDIVLLVVAPLWLRTRRAMKRPGMTPEKLGVVLARQLDDHTKRNHADGVITTGGGYAETARQVKWWRAKAIRPIA